MPPTLYARHARPWLWYHAPRRPAGAVHATLPCLRPRCGRAGVDRDRAGPSARGVRRGDRPRRWTRAADRDPRSRPVAHALARPHQRGRSPREARRLPTRLVGTGGRAAPVDALRARRGAAAIHDRPDDVGAQLLPAAGGAREPRRPAAPDAPPGGTTRAQARRGGDRRRHGHAAAGDSGRQRRGSSPARRRPRGLQPRGTADAGARLLHRVHAVASRRRARPDAGPRAVDPRRPRPGRRPGVLRRTRAALSAARAGAVGATKSRT